MADLVPPCVIIASHSPPFSFAPFSPISLLAAFTFDESISCTRHVYREEKILFSASLARFNSNFCVCSPFFLAIYRAKHKSFLHSKIISLVAFPAKIDPQQHLEAEKGRRRGEYEAENREMPATRDARRRRRRREVYVGGYF